jgi:hypothetical protein
MLLIGGICSKEGTGTGVGSQAEILKQLNMGSLKDFGAKATKIIARSKALIIRWRVYQVKVS